MPNRLFQPLPLHPCCLLTELLLVPGLVLSPNSTSKCTNIDPCANQVEKKRKRKKKEKKKIK